MRPFATILAALSTLSCLVVDLPGETEGSGMSNPPTGVWSYNDGGFSMNTCGTEDLYRDPDTTFVLTNRGDGTFTVAQGDEYGDFECTITGSTFDCPERLAITVPVDMADAVLSYHVSIAGDFASNTDMSGEQTATISCTGSDCSLAPVVLGTTLPCSYGVNFTAAFGL